MSYVKARLSVSPRTQFVLIGVLLRENLELVELHDKIYITLINWSQSYTYIDLLHETRGLHVVISFHFSLHGVSSKLCGS